MSGLTSFSPFLAIAAGIVFFTKLPPVFRAAAAKDLLTSNKATQLSHAVRLGGIMFIGVGLVATVYMLALMK